VPRPVDHAKREELLDEASEVLARTGVVDTSLRSLATEMGTSARMLIYYFGSKENLILSVLRRQVVVETVLLSTVDEFRQWCLDDWQAVTRGSKRASVRILEQVFGAACGQDSPYADYAAATLSHLVHNSQARLEAIGMPSDIAHARSRLALAAIQGLVIEYFTTDDPAPVDETYRQLIDDILLAPYTPRIRRGPAPRSLTV
jgi:AcrR family transcriptional regulator